MVIKIVASSFLGFSSKVTMIFASLLSLDNSFKSVCDNEKNATSAPEIRAELIKSKTSIIVFIILTRSIEENNSSKGSGSESNFKLF